MKKVIVYLLVFFCCRNGWGQTQEIQQLVMDIEKLAQLKAMYQSMVNGYNTLIKGYGDVINLSKGNFDLHKTYLDGLMAVNPLVKKYGKIKSITASQLLIAKEYSDAYRRFYASGLFSATELLAMKAGGNMILDESVKALDELLVIVTPGALRMNDAERIAAIDQLDEEMNAHLKALRQMFTDSQQLLLLRLQNQRDVKQMKILTRKK